MLFEYQLSLCLTMSVHRLLLPGCYQFTKKANCTTNQDPPDSGYCNIKNINILAGVIINLDFQLM